MRRENRSNKKYQTVESAARWSNSTHLDVMILNVTQNYAYLERLQI
jgi:hypothetical protein